MHTLNTAPDNEPRRGGSTVHTQLAALDVFAQSGGWLALPSSDCLNELIQNVSLRP